MYSRFMPARLGTLLFFLASMLTASDRQTAEWVLRLGGTVVLHGNSQRIHDVTQLPAGEFRLHTVNLVPLILQPAEFARLAGLSELRELYISGRTWHSLPTKTSRESFQHLSGFTKLEKLVLSLPVQTDVQLEDTAIAAIAPLVNLKELRLAQTKVKGRTLGPFALLRALDLKNTPTDNDGMRNVAGMKMLEKLNLRDTMITDEGLASLAGLTALTDLDLYGTRISDAGLVHLAGLTNLRRLNLLGGDISDAGLDQLAKLTRLEELNLYRTKITNAGLEKLKRFPQLAKLDLRYSRVNRGGVASLRAARPKCVIAFLDATVESAQAKPVRVAATNASEVSLAKTQATDAEVRPILQRAGLRSLDLSVTQAGNPALDAIPAQCELVTLSMANTTVSDAGLKNLARCRGLRQLDLSHTLVEGPGLAHLAALSSLEDLRLGSTTVTSEDLRHLAGLAQLQVLDLSHTDITNDGLVHLKGLTSLRELHLTGSDIGDPGLVHIGAMPSLQVLLLGYGRFTDKGIASLAGLSNLTRLEMVRTRIGDNGLATTCGPEEAGEAESRLHRCDGQGTGSAFRDACADRAAAG